MSYLPPHLEGVVNLEWWAIWVQKLRPKRVLPMEFNHACLSGFLLYKPLLSLPSSLPANSSSLLISLRPSREQWESLHLLRLCSHSYSCASLALSMLFPLLIFLMFKTQMK